MMRKFVAYLLIIFLIIPPTLFLQPKNADAFIVFGARAILGMAVRTGVPQFLKTKATIYLKPIGGKLYNATINNYWTPFVTDAAITLGVLSLFPFGSIDKRSIVCQTVRVVSSRREPIGGDYLAETLNLGLQMAITDALPLIPFAKDYVLSPTSTQMSGEFGQFLPDGTFFTKGTLTCLNTVNKDITAYDDFMINEIDVLPPNSDTAKSNKADQILNAAQQALKNNPNQTVGTDPNAAGFVLEEVQSQTYTDANGVVHHITKDPTTGALLDNGVPMPDEAVVLDANGVVHHYTIDPITGNILDNGQPVGNFAQWTDSEGVQHTITVDPQTGRLFDNGQPWNPNYTVSNPSNGSPTTPPIAFDPYTGNAVADLTPLIDVNNRTLLEQKKTTDAIINTNKKLDDLNKVSTDIKKSSKLQENLLTDIYTTLQNQNNVNTSSFTETRPMTLQGVQTTAQNIINSSSIATWGDALRVAGPSGLPVFTIPTAFGDVAFDTSTYKFVFDSLGYLTLIAAGYISILIVFRSK